MLKKQIQKTKKFISDNDTKITGGIGFVGGVAATLYCLKRVPVTQFHHEFFPSETAAEIATMLAESKAIDISCPHGVVTLFASDFVEQ